MFHCGVPLHVPEKNAKYNCKEKSVKYYLPKSEIRNNL